MTDHHNQPHDQPNPLDNPISLGELFSDIPANRQDANPYFFSHDQFIRKIAANVIDARDTADLAVAEFAAFVPEAAAAPDAKGDDALILYNNMTQAEATASMLESLHQKRQQSPPDRG